MRRNQLLQAIAGACLSLLAWLNVEGATFTTNALITEADTSFDGQDIVVDGATLTVDGRHSFNSLLLTNGAVLTHSHCTTTKTHKIDLVVSNEVAFSTHSRIDMIGNLFPVNLPP